MRTQVSRVHECKRPVQPIQSPVTAQQQRHDALICSPVGDSVRLISVSSNQAAHQQDPPLSVLKSYLAFQWVITMSGCSPDPQTSKFWEVVQAAHVPGPEPNQLHFMRNVCTTLQGKKGKKNGGCHHKKQQHGKLLSCSWRTRHCFLKDDEEVVAKDLDVCVCSHRRKDLCHKSNLDQEILVHTQCKLTPDAMCSRPY